MVLAAMADFTGPQKRWWSTHLINNDLGSHLIDGVHWNALVKEIGRSDNILKGCQMKSSIRKHIKSLLRGVFTNREDQVGCINSMKGTAAGRLTTLTRHGGKKREEQPRCSFLIRQYSHEQTILEEWGFEILALTKKNQVTLQVFLRGFLWSSS